MTTAKEYNQNHAGHITLPNIADSDLIAATVQSAMK
jgi:hypothetical protein